MSNGDDNKDTEFATHMPVKKKKKAKRPAASKGTKKKASKGSKKKAAKKR
jgi:hypothetical protein